jgi:hypothetical protein
VEGEGVFAKVSGRGVWILRCCETVVHMSFAALSKNCVFFAWRG